MSFSTDDGDIQITQSKHEKLDASAAMDEEGEEHTEDAECLSQISGMLISLSSSNRN